MSAGEGLPFDADQRSQLTRRILDLTRRQGRAEGAGRLERRDLASELAELRRQYAHRVPRPIVSHDPLSKQPFRLGIDTFGLDGLWWELDGPPRPTDEPLPLTWYAFHGAMRLVEPYEDNPFTVKVGTIAPFVVPRLLRRPDVVAVVSTVPVGHHTGWLTVYFAPWPGHPPGTRINEWARNSYRYRPGPGRFVLESSIDFPLEWDFDLGPWIEAGRVLWTPPDDPGAPAVTGVDGCPYLDLLRPGDPRGMGILAYGELEYAQVPPDLDDSFNPNEERG